MSEEPVKAPRAKSKGSRPRKQSRPAVKAVAVNKERSSVDTLLPGTALPPPRSDPEQEVLQRSLRTDLLPPARKDGLPKEVRARQPRLEREPVDHSAEVAMRAEEMRREDWRKAIEEDEARRGPNRQRNPRLPLMADAQIFRAPEVAEVPDDARVPDGHAPKWVGTKDTLSTGKESMVLIRHHEQFGYTYVRDKNNQVIVTEYGVLMSATYADAARRQHHLTPKGSMRTEDSSERMREFADRENRRSGRRVVGVAELPDHRRRYSDHLEVE